MNVSIGKQEEDRNNNRMWAFNMPTQSMGKELYGKMVDREVPQENASSGKYLQTQCL